MAALRIRCYCCVSLTDGEAEALTVWVTSIRLQSQGGWSWDLNSGNLILESNSELFPSAVPMHHIATLFTTWLCYASQYRRGNICPHQLFDVGLGHVTLFGQWNISGSDSSRDFQGLDSHLSAMCHDKNMPWEAVSPRVWSKLNLQPEAKLSHSSSTQPVYKSTSEK